MFRLVLRTVEKQEKKLSSTVEAIRLDFVSKCLFPDWQL